MIMGHLVIDRDVDRPKGANRNTRFNRGAARTGRSMSQLLGWGCIRLLVCIVSVSSLSQTVSGSAVVAIMTGTEIVVAADSQGEFTDKGKTSTVNYCKIRQIETAVFVCAGLVRVNEAKYDAYTIIPESIKGINSFAGKVAAAENNMMPLLTQAMRYLKRNRAEEFAREYELQPAVTFMLFGIENQTLKFAMRQFNVRTVDSDEISISITKTDWPESPVKPLIAYAGRVEEIRAYLAQHRSFDRLRPSELARFLVTMEIIERQDVAGPIDILSIDRAGNPHWIERKPDCDRQ
jgi:hypothetical protein